MTDLQPKHIHLEINTGSQDLESCDLRLYSVEESDETQEEKTHDTICAGSELDSTKSGTDIEKQGANSHKGTGGSDDDETTERRLEDKDGNGETADKNNDDETTGDDDKSETTDKGDDKCTHGEKEIEKSPEGFDKYIKVKHSDIAFLRAGYFNHVKLNTDSMIHKFEQDKWIKIDMLIDWDAQTVSIYADDEGVRAVPFFTKRGEKMDSMNAVAIYGLTPEGISRFRNLQVCTDLCSESKCFNTCLTSLCLSCRLRFFQSVRWIPFRVEQRTVYNGIVGQSLPRTLCMTRSI